MNVQILDNFSAFDDMIRMMYGLLLCIFKVFEMGSFGLSMDIWQGIYKNYY